MGSGSRRGFQRVVDCCTATPRRLRFSLSLVGVTCLLVSTGLLAATPAQAYDVHGPAWSLNSAISSSPTECLDVPNGSKTAGQYVQQWACNGNAWQEWVRRQTIPTHGGYLSNFKPFLIVNNYTGKCLSILNNSNSAPAAVIQWNCDYSGNDLYELWFQPPSQCGTYLGHAYFYNTNLGQWNSSGAPYREIHASGGGLSNGLHIYVNDNGPINQYCYYNPPLVIPA
jgi:hypothetical protein